MSNINPKYVREKWTIKLGSDGFYLEGPDGGLLVTGTPQTPRQLAHYAWSKGAQEVVFDFDLNLDPDK